MTMPSPYEETTDWPGTAWAFAIWAAHFSMLWAASSIFPDRAPARWIALIATTIAIGVLWGLWRARAPDQTRPRDRRILMLAVGVAAVAIVFGAVPALVG